MARVALPGARAVSELIARYDLHAEAALPISIRQVARDDGWVIRFSEQMRHLYGLAVVVENIRVMQINARISEPFQRMAIAHEMGHVLNGHVGGLYLCSAPSSHFTDWLRDREEREASAAAAQILIPEWVVREFGAIAEIAAACEVPVELVELVVG